MGLTEKDLARLGPAAQKQIREELSRRDTAKKARRLQTSAARQGPLLPEADSELEQRYYAAELWPKIMAGLVISVQLHKQFLLYPADTYCGLRLPAAHYTPDFLVTYTNGTVEAVEVKHDKIRKLQRDYIYRRRLFIEKYARPNGWKFTEYIESG